MEINHFASKIMSVSEYVNKFDELMVYCDVDEEPRLTRYRFRSGVRPDISTEILFHLPIIWITLFNWLLS